jgi:hypothetical protein
VTAPSTYAALTFWPGSIILTEPTDSATNNGGEPRLYTDIAGQTGITVGGYINSYGANAPTVFAQQCSGPSTWSSIWMSCPAGDSISNNYAAVGALLLQVGAAASGSGGGGLKGRLNLMAPSSSSSATHLITLGDSNPAKTLATPGHRPTNDASDTWIGLDNPSSNVSGFQLAFGAPVSISSYIGAVGNPQTDIPLEKLDKNLKTFNLPIKSTVTTISGQAPLSVQSSVSVDTLTVSNHPKMQYCGTTATCSASPTLKGQIVFGTIPFPSNANSVTLNGINPAFTSNFNCVANDLTNPAHGVNASPQSGTSVLFTGPAGSGGDVISYQCVGS